MEILELVEKVNDLEKEFIVFRADSYALFSKSDQTLKHISESLQLLNGNIQKIVDRMYSETEHRLTECSVHKEEFMKESRKYVDDSILWRLSVPGMVIIIMQVLIYFRK